MSRHDKYILDANHQLVAVSLMEWAQWFERDSHRRVAEDTIDGYYVSTVFLGLDHSFSGTLPLVFETMIFAEGGDRKSTRLNSSHQIISYAVFCLKKKKKPHSNTLPAP